MKRGRPKLPAGEKKQVFHVRLSPEERKLVEQAAKRAKARPSEWARRKLMEQPGGNEA